MSDLVGWTANFRIEKVANGKAHIYPVGIMTDRCLIVPVETLPDYAIARGIRASISLETLEQLRSRCIPVDRIEDVMWNIEPYLSAPIAVRTTEEILNELDRIFGGGYRWLC